MTCFERLVREGGFLTAAALICDGKTFLVPSMIDLGGGDAGGCSN